MKDKLCSYEVDEVCEEVEIHLSGIRVASVYFDYETKLSEEQAVKIAEYWVKVFNGDE